MSQDTPAEIEPMPKRSATPRKRKLPPGVTGMAEFVEAKRVAQVERNRQAFMRLPEAERRRQLMAMLNVRVEIKKPGDESPG